MTAASFAWYSGLCVAQGAIVIFPGAVRARWLAALRARWLWIAVPTAAVTAATFLPRVAALFAVDLSSLALALVPPLALLGLGWAMRWHDWKLAVLVPVVLAVAWSAPRSPAGEAAALLLVSSSCVALAAVIVAIVPRTVAKIGILLWAAADLSVALAHRLEAASRAITEAAPAVPPALRSLQLQHLQLQRVVLGSASMEYADLFLAAALGAVLAAQSRSRGPASLLVATLAVAFAALFLVSDVLPATVPVAVALAVGELRSWRARRRPPVQDGSTISPATPSPKTTTARIESGPRRA
jgi:hypothetical protein